jgi:hypothetical protein
MTRKDYVFIASILAKAGCGAGYAADDPRRLVTTHIARECVTQFAADNPRFNPHKFLVAAGITLPSLNPREI